MANKNDEIVDRLKILLNPWVTIAAIITGVLIGITSQSLSAQLAPFGDIYLSLLQMCLIPILICTVVSNIAKLLRTGQAQIGVGRIVRIFFLGMIFAATFGALIGIYGNVGGGLDNAAQAALGQMVAKSEKLATSGHQNPSGSLMGLVREMVPSNIFSAIVQGKNLPILFFSILMGISFGLVNTPGTAVALSISEAVFEALLKLVNGSMYGLPFGLICILANHVSKLGSDIFVALGKFMLFAYLGGGVLVLFFIFAIARGLGAPVLKVVLALKEPFLVALATSSSFAAIPSSLLSLEKNLKVSKKTSNLMFPLGVCLHLQGSAFFFALATVFVAQLYHLQIGIEQLLIIIIGSFLTSIAASGIPGVTTFTMIAIVLTPLGLPLETAIVLNIAAAPVVDPIVTLANVAGNCAVTFMVSRPKTAVAEGSRVAQMFRSLIS